MRRARYRIMGLGLIALTRYWPHVACSDDKKPARHRARRGPAVARPPPPHRHPTGEPIIIGFINNEGGAFSVPELRVGNEVAEDVHQRPARRRERPADRGRALRHRRHARVGDRLRERAHRGGRRRRHRGHRPRRRRRASAADRRRHPDARSRPVRRRPHVRPQLVLLRRRRHRLRRRRPRSTTRTRAPRRSVVPARRAASHAFTDGFLLPTAEKLGIDYKTVYYDPANPNWAVLAATAVSENPDASGSVAATDAQCAEMVPALKDAGYQGRILAASCFNLDDGHRRQGDRGRHRRRPLAPRRHRRGAGRQAGRARGVHRGHGGRRPRGPRARQRAHHVRRHDHAAPRPRRPSRATIDGASISAALLAHQGRRQLRRPDDHLRPHRHARELRVPRRPAVLPGPGRRLDQGPHRRLRRLGVL